MQAKINTIKEKDSTSLLMNNLEEGGQSWACNNFDILQSSNRIQTHMTAYLSL